MNYDWLDLSVNLSVLVPLLLALLGYYKERRDRRDAEMARKRKLLQALKMEIDLNLEGLSKSNGEFPSDEQFSQKIDESREFRPLIMLHYTADIYRANTEQLSDLSPKVAGEIISFYQSLSFVKTLAEATGALAYATISVEGRKALPRRIRSELKTAIESGTDVSKELDAVIARYE